MATGKHDKELEASYRRGYHQGVNECLRLVEAAVEQQVSPLHLLRELTTWEKQLAAWRATIDAANVLAPPPRPLTPHLRLASKEELE